MAALTASGAVLENTVLSLFEKKGFKKVSSKDYLLSPGKYGHELIITNAPFTTIYGHKGKTEFLVKSDKYNLDLRIECKWQQVNGSVDEKLPYLYLNAIEAMPEKNIIILIDGDGWKPGSITWFKDAVREKKYTDQNFDKFIEIMNIKQFITWANKLLK